MVWAIETILVKNADNSSKSTQHRLHCLSKEPTVTEPRIGGRSSDVRNKYLRTFYIPFTRYNRFENRLKNGLDNRLNVCIYTTQPVVQPVVKPVWQPVGEPIVSCMPTFNRLSNRLHNRLYRVNGILRLLPPLTPNSQQCCWAIEELSSFLYSLTFSVPIRNFASRSSKIWGNSPPG